MSLSWLKMLTKWKLQLLTENKCINYGKGKAYLFPFLTRRISLFPNKYIYKWSFVPDHQHIPAILELQEYQYPPWERLAQAYSWSRQYKSYDRVSHLILASMHHTETEKFIWLFTLLKNRVFEMYKMINDIIAENMQGYLKYISNIIYLFTKWSCLTVGPIYSHCSL